MRERESISGREASLRGCARKQASEHAPVRTHAVAGRHNDCWVSLALSHRAARVRASIPRASGSRCPFGTPVPSGHASAFYRRRPASERVTKTTKENGLGFFRRIERVWPGQRMPFLLTKEGRKERAKRAVSIRHAGKRAVSFTGQKVTA